MILAVFFFIGALHTFTSDNGQYHLQAEFYGGTVFEVRTFTMRRGDDLLYRIDDPGVQTFFVSDHGTVFGLSEHHAAYYDRSGRCDSLLVFARMNTCGFSEYHDLFYLSVQEGVFVYTLDGHLLYDLMPGRLFASTRHGENIAIVSDDTLRLYRDGVLVRTEILGTAYVHRVSFTGSTAVRVETHGGIELFDMTVLERVER